VAQVLDRDRGGGKHSTAYRLLVLRPLPSPRTAAPHASARTFWQVLHGRVGIDGVKGDKDVLGPHPVGIEAEQPDDQKFLRYFFRFRGSSSALTYWMDQGPMP
jgi:hypothetical protein